jgi:hypothetical protein
MGTPGCWPAGTPPRHWGYYRSARRPGAAPPRSGGTASNVAGVWTTRTANISAWAGQTIQLRVEALDANPGSLIEAGVGNVTIIRQ